MAVIDGASLSERRVNRRYKKTAPKARLLASEIALLSLACLKTRVLLIDHVDATLAANNAAILIAQFKCFKRVSDFHRITFCSFI